MAVESLTVVDSQTKKSKSEMLRQFCELPYK